MPLDPTIPLSVKPLDLTNKLSEFINLGRTGLALQRERQTYGADVAQRQAESERARTSADVAAATAPAQINVAQQTSAQADIGTNLARFRLQGEQSQKMLDIATSFLQDPDFKSGNSDGMIDKLADAEQQAIQMGVPRTTARALVAPLTNLAATNPMGVQQRLAALVKSGMSAPGQAGQSLVTAAGQQQTGPTDVRGNPTVQARDEFGNLRQGALPQVAPQTQPGPLQFPPGENAGTYQQLNVEREAARTTMLKAPEVHRLNTEILAELEKATTGQYSGIIAKGQSIAGMLGMSLTGDNEQERAASAYDLVDKYTTMAATRAAQSMGNDTATALNAQLKQNASVERNPTAIKKSIKFNDAVLSGVEVYQQGLEKTIAKNPQADVFAKRKFDQAWAQNFDPLVMQIYQAKKSGDKEELHDLVTKPAGVDQATWNMRMSQIQQKAANLQRLITQGL